MASVSEVTVTPFTQPHWPAWIMSCAPGTKTQPVLGVSGAPHPTEVMTITSSAGRIIGREFNMRPPYSSNRWDPRGARTLACRLHTLVTTVKNEAPSVHTIVNAARMSAQCHIVLGGETLAWRKQLRME